MNIYPGSNCLYNGNMNVRKNKMGVSTLSKNMGVVF